MLFHLLYLFIIEIRCHHNHEHHLCVGECTENFLSSCFAHGNEISYPLKCRLCNIELPSLHVERNLNEEQLSIIASLMAKEDGDVEHTCSNCTLQFLVPCNLDVFHCTGCQYFHCRVCTKSFPSADGMRRNNQCEPLKHILDDGCQGLSEIKKDFEKALLQGGQGVYIFSISFHLVVIIYFKC